MKAYPSTEGILKILYMIILAHFAGKYGTQSMNESVFCWHGTLRWVKVSLMVILGRRASQTWGNWYNLLLIWSGPKLFSFRILMATTATTNIFSVFNSADHRTENL